MGEQIPLPMELTILEVASEVRVFPLLGPQFLPPAIMLIILPSTYVIVAVIEELLPVSMLFTLFEVPLINLSRPLPCD